MPCDPWLSHLCKKRTKPSEIHDNPDWDSLAASRAKRSPSTTQVGYQGAQEIPQGLDPEYFEPSSCAELYGHTRRRMGDKAPRRRDTEKMRNLGLIAETEGFENLEDQIGRTPGSPRIGHFFRHPALIRLYNLPKR